MEGAFMQTRYFALIFGIIYTIVGLAGFIPGLLTRSPELPPIAVDGLYGYLLGLFAVNILHTLVHLGLGIWGIAAWRSFAGARGYANSLAIIFGVLTLIGIIPATNTLFGLVPLFGHDIWLHGLTALVAAYFGWVAAPDVATDAGSTVRRY
jgi:hypothetical protein